MTKNLKQSIALRISLLLVGMIMLCALAVGASSVWLYRSDNIDANAVRAQDIALSAAAMIDPDEFVTIMATLEKNDHWHAAKRMLDEVAINTGIAYLYVLDGNYTNEMTYFAEGYNPNSGEEEIDLGDTESLVMDGEDTYAAEMFEVLRDGTSRMTDIYDSGGWGMMVSGFAPITTGSGRIVGVVGVDVSVDEVNSATWGFALQIVLIVLLFCVALGALCVRMMHKLIGVPLGTLTEATDKMAAGNVSARLDMDRSDEIGLLAAAFDRMTVSTQEQVSVLERLADGDLTMDVALRGPGDAMGIAMRDTLESLNDMFHNVIGSAAQVSMGAQQIASASQSLATGSTQQAAAVEELSASVSEILVQSQQNAQEAMNAYNDTGEAGRLMNMSITSMGEMTTAMAEINQSSQQIAKVIKVIEDIAFQTNILALNASVEAARAGQQGKGFSVVAEEVRNLATRSDAAAKETAGLIENSSRKIGEGGRIAGQTSEDLLAVAELAARNAAAMESINQLSSSQSHAIAEVTSGIDQVSSVVQENSATSEQTAASAEEMASQAHMLNQMVARFRLKEPNRRMDYDMGPASDYPQLY